MKTGERLFQFLRGLALDRFFGTVTIKYEHGKVTHVETDTRRRWEYKDLPERTGEPDDPRPAIRASPGAWQMPQGK